MPSPNQSPVSCHYLLHMALQRSRSMLVWLVPVALFGAACSGSDDEATPTVTEPVTTDPPAVTTTTDAGPASTSPTTSVEVATTEIADTTTTSSTAPAPTTTTLEDLRLEIEADLNEGEVALFAAGASPEGAPERERVAIYFGGDSLQVIDAFLDRLVSDGLLLRPNPAIENRTTVVGVVDVDGDEVLINRCRVDGAVVYEPTSDGGEIVVDDEIVVNHTISSVVLEGGVWQLRGGEAVAPESGVPPCDV